MSQFDIPIVIIAYNRPHLVQKILQVVKNLSPQSLYLIVDGASSNRPNDQEKCQQVREILSNIDWDCHVFGNYSESNLGCGNRIPSGLDWVFKQVEMAIVLEDDCLPDPSFFQFCRVLLHRYQDDPTVTQICGTNRLIQWKHHQQSYHFARYGSAWGWATWRRVWQQYHQHSQLWQNSLIREKIKQIIGDSSQYDYFCLRYHQTMANPRLIWDYQWSLVQLAQEGKSIIPAVNLVQNLGFAEDGTHTTHFCLSHLLQKVEPISFPLQEPLLQDYDDDYDRKHFAWSMGKPEPDSLMLMIDILVEQKRLVHSLLLLNKAIALFPQSHLFLEKRQQVLEKTLKKG